MGFNDKWRGWMRECFSSNSISILVNGSPTTEFVAQKGIKQGDPLASFLFLIAAEGLAGLVRKGEESNNLKGIELNENLSISMLQFADDTIFLCDGKDKSVRCLKAILRSFEMVSGLKVNFSKSSVIGINMEDRKVQGISSFLACKVGAIPFKFLGVPVGANPRRTSTWQPIVDSIKSKLSHWRSMKLSIGGRVALINSVLSSLPLYLFSMFKAPKKTIDEIQRLQRRFLWGGDEEHKKMAWIKWENICKRKEIGGLGIKDLNTFNIALLTKWRWRLLTESTQPLWKRVLEARYGEFSAWIESASHSRSIQKSSLWWRDLVLLGDGSRLDREWFQRVVKKQIGNGATVKFWSDTWLGTETLAELFPSLFQQCDCKSATVLEMGNWIENRWQWNMSWAATLGAGDSDNSNALVQLLTGTEPSRDVADKWIWLPSSARGFTVKECYNWMMAQHSCNVVHQEAVLTACKALWKNDLPSKILIFSWRVLINKLPTRDKLLHRGILAGESEASCAFCNAEIESNDHIFSNCATTQSVWNRIFAWLGDDSSEECLDEGVLVVFNVFKNWLKGKNTKRVRHLIWAATLWNI